jgi:16S rRNA G966 N2-methylase RsmD
MINYSRVAELITYLQPQSKALNIYKQNIHTLKATSRIHVLVNGAAVINAHARNGTEHRARVYPFIVLRQNLKIPRSIEGRCNTSVTEDKRVEILKLGGK